MAKVKVRSLDWEDTEEDAIEFNHIDPDFPSDAIRYWCEEKDCRGSFTDGYPDNHKVEVIYEDGKRMTFVVTTEFTPEYRIHREK